MVALKLMGDSLSIKNPILRGIAVLALTAIVFLVCYFVLYQHLAKNVLGITNDLSMLVAGFPFAVYVFVHYSFLISQSKNKPVKTRR
jgi:hypothetical protein